MEHQIGSSELDTAFAAIVEELGVFSHLERICVLSYSPALSGLDEETCLALAEEVFFAESCYQGDLLFDSSSGFPTASELVVLLAEDPLRRIFLSENVEEPLMLMANSPLVEALARVRYVEERDMDKPSLDASLCYVDAFVDDNGDLQCDPYYDDECVWERMGGEVQSEMILNSGPSMDPSLLRRIIKSGIPRALLPAAIAHPSASRGSVRAVVAACTSSDVLALSIALNHPLADERTKAVARELLGEP